MAEVTLNIGGRQYDVNCRDGEENHLFRLAEMIDAKMAATRKNTPGLTEIRQLLFAAILLADETHDLRLERNRGQSSLNLPQIDDSAAEEMMAGRISALASRIERLADKLAGNDAAP
ncbi:MAG: cell division protein ZapA [Sphingobium sp.]